MEFHPKHYQPTPNPDNPPINEIKNEISIQNIIEQINDLKSQIRISNKQIEEKARTLDTLTTEINEMKGIALCSICRYNAYQ